MLVTFSIKNFLSFREKATFDMTAVASDDCLPGNKLFLHLSRPMPRPVELLKSAVIYGPNASGKTNILSAFTAFRSFICDGHKKGGKTPFEAFALDPQQRLQPSEFEIVLLLDGTRYRYGIMADNIRIHEEWLFAADLSQERFIFERTLNSDGTYSYEYGPTGKKFAAFERHDFIRKDVPLLFIGNSFNEKIAETVYLAIANIKYPSIHYHDEFDEAAIPLLTMILQYIDIGLHNIEIKPASLETFEYLLSADFPGISESKVKSFKNSVRKTLPILKDRKDKFFIYRDSDGKSVPMPEDSQSRGTIRIFDLFYMLLSEYKRGSILLLDEIEASLHPMLCEAFFNVFHAMPDNNVQLICTTHNSVMLNEDIFRRDQVWITEKDALGGTKLYSISDFKGTRKMARLGKQYLEGRFGGLPILDTALLRGLIEQLAGLNVSASTEAAENE